MSSALRRCIPSASRMLHPRTRVFCRHNSSNIPKDERGEEASTDIGTAQGIDRATYNLPDPLFDDETVHRYKPTKMMPTRPGSFVRESNWDPMFFDINELVRNPRSVFRSFDDEDLEDIENEIVPGREAKAAGEEMSPLRHLHIPFENLGRLHRYPLLTRRVVQQTGKGKIQSQYALIVVGNGDGLVGLGEGKASSAPEAAEKAFGQAIRNMDFVDRFEKRTLWTSIDTKFGATRILMRPRPVGFGLACAPGIHQVLKAAGVKDCSAKVWGSRNKLNVIKAAIRVLHAGHMPLAMGDGIGGSGRRLEAGYGMRGKAAVERERGRVIASGRTW